jgi:hypothetical protein
VITALRVPAPETPSMPQVEAAIALVASGRYPRVAVAGIPDARGVLALFRLTAARRGVQLLIDLADDGHAVGIIAQRA